MKIHKGIWEDKYKWIMSEPELFFRSKNQFLNFPLPVSILENGNDEGRNGRVTTPRAPLLHIGSENTGTNGHNLLL